MYLIDTHAHLDIPPLDSDTAKIIKNSLDAKVEKIITIGIDIDSSKKAINYANNWEIVYASVGIHPNHANDIKRSDFDIIKRLSTEKKVIAIGEIGLDYYRDYCPKEMQKYVFLNQIDIAKENKLPIIVHSREANNDVYDILKENAKGLKVVFHCFSGDVDFARKILDLGYFISFTGVITFPKAELSREVVRYVPLDRIFLETDCPFLAPVPKRGKTNEPAYLTYIVEELANIKKIDIEEAARCTTENARVFFNL